jgi:NAD(P)-dependent dehydrogenase (short-subunit alcohol dehydrogenase family)
MPNYIVFAASSTIGQTIVTQLKSEGHSVFQTARNNEKISPDAVLDLTDFDAVNDCFSKAMTQFGQIDGVVNCSGSLLLKPAHLTSKANYQTTIDSSLTTSFAIVRAAGQHMTNGGSVVLISSAAAMTGLANHEAIAAAKAGVIGLAMSCAATYAGQNLRFNVISPGLVETTLTQGITGNPTSRKFSEQMHALGHIGQPADIARAVCFLLDTKNNWITGQVLAVDGGLSRVQPKIKASA